MPDVIQKALESGPPARRSTGNRDSLQRKQYWWLPYVVLEFDKNEILVEALGGDLSKPEWNYRADLYVSSSSFVVGGNVNLLLSAMSRVHPIFLCRHICGQPSPYKVKRIWATTS